MRLAPLLAALLAVPCIWAADPPATVPGPAPVTPSETTAPATTSAAPAAATATPAPAASHPSPAPADGATSAGKKSVSLHYLDGTVTVGDNLATIDLPTGYHFLQTKDARFVIEKLWGNPPSQDILGMIVPPKQEDAFEWAIVVQFDATGYVKDDDAKSNDYTKILGQMQESLKEENPERKKAGYPAVDLLGWAEAPQYDATTHKIYWARRMKFENAQGVTLNYDIRILGRKGVLILRAVADDVQLAMVAENSKAVLAKTAFTSGNRYEDFSSSSGDKVAEYGIAGLITGAVLLKTGLLKLLIKPLIIGGAVLVAVVRKLMNRNSAASRGGLEPLPTPPDRQAPPASGGSGT
jgi:uncharacterized membrane-anchored protein